MVHRQSASMSTVGTASPRPSGGSGNLWDTPEAGEYPRPAPQPPRSDEKGDNWSRVKGKVYEVVKEAKRGISPSELLDRSEPKSPRPSMGSLGLAKISSRRTSEARTSYDAASSNASNEDGAGGSSRSFARFVDKSKDNVKRFASGRSSSINKPKQVDPLHQWMVSHSGGTLVDKRPSWS